MKFTLALLCASLLTFVMAETVEEAWAAYKLNPNKELSLGYVGADGIVKDAGEIQDFERFKKNWNEAKAFNSQYASTEDAWTAYKIKRNKNYSQEEDAMRFKIFKREWEDILAHNERYARGEIYYPIYSRYYLDETEEERIERMNRPMN